MTYTPRTEPLRIFIGYDSKEPVAFHVLSHSILRHSSVPVTIMPLVQSVLRDAGLYTRKRQSTESTEFSITRFLVPYLAGYRGQALFMDCDMLCQGDVAELFEMAHYSARPYPSPRMAVHVVQHEYQTTQEVKFLGQVNLSYPRKNWSSVMMFDCERCSQLTPERVNILSGLELHRFSWIKDEELGKLPETWNWLVGEYEANPYAKLLHYTLGGPWFEPTRYCDQADLWKYEWERMSTPGAVLV